MTRLQRLTFAAVLGAYLLGMYDTLRIYGRELDRAAMRELLSRPVPEPAGERGAG